MGDVVWGKAITIQRLKLRLPRAEALAMTTGYEDETDFSAPRNDRAKNRHLNCLTISNELRYIGGNGKLLPYIVFL